MEVRTVTLRDRYKYEKSQLDKTFNYLESPFKYFYFSGIPIAAQSRRKLLENKKNFQSAVSNSYNVTAHVGTAKFLYLISNNYISIIFALIDLKFSGYISVSIS